MSLHGRAELRRRFSAKMPSVPARSLGQIELSVGIVDHLLHGERFGVIPGESNSNTDCKPEWSIACVEMEAFYRLANALGDAAGALGVGVGQEHGELLATVAGDKIDIAEVPLDDACDGLEHVVSCLMAVGVVNALEMIEVKNQQRPVAKTA